MNFGAEYSLVLQLGLTLAGSSALVVVFLRTLRDKSGDHLREASLAWQQVYESTKASLDDMRQEQQKLQRRIDEDQAIIAELKQTLLNQSTQIATMKIAHEKELEVLKKTIAEKNEAIKIQAKTIALLEAQPSAKEPS